MSTIGVGGIGVEVGTAVGGDSLQAETATAATKLTNIAMAVQTGSADNNVRVNADLTDVGIGSISRKWQGWQDAVSNRTRNVFWI